jgi:hypothetical protein
MMLFGPWQNERRSTTLQTPIDEVPPGYYDRSVGHWEGDTLVIDTVGIKEAVQYQRMPPSDQMRIKERIRMVAPDIIHDQITIEDPANSSGCRLKRFSTR